MRSLDAAEIRAVTFDFGNTLVPVERAGLDRVVETTARSLAEQTGQPLPTVLEIWEQERARQWREDVPAFRETDLSTRVRRVLARLHGTVAPRDDRPWDDAALGAAFPRDEVAKALDVYSAALAELASVPDATAVLTELDRRGYRLAILSNWPLAASIDRYVEAHGWSAYLAGIVVSERVGTIKPQPAIFRAAETLLGVGPGSILHVGDDWDADVVGARQAGWRTAHLRSRPPDSPLPGSVPSGTPADAVIDTLSDLLPLLPERLAAAESGDSGIAAWRP